VNDVDKLLGKEIKIVRNPAYETNLIGDVGNIIDIYNSWDGGVFCCVDINGKNYWLSRRVFEYIEE